MNNHWKTESGWLPRQRQKHVRHIGRSSSLCTSCTIFHRRDNNDSRNSALQQKWICTCNCKMYKINCQKRRKASQFALHSKKPLTHLIPPPPSPSPQLHLCAFPWNIHIPTLRAIYQILFISNDSSEFLIMFGTRLPGSRCHNYVAEWKWSISRFQFSIWFCIAVLIENGLPSHGSWWISLLLNNE